MRSIIDHQENGQQRRGDSDMGPWKVAEGEVDDDGRSKITGTVWTASAHNHSNCWVGSAVTGLGAIKKSNCFHKEGHGVPCKHSNNPLHDCSWTCRNICLRSQISISFHGPPPSQQSCLLGIQALEWDTHFQRSSQDTLRSTPPEKVKKANVIATCKATTLYLTCSCLGYAALGNNAPGNLLTGFGFYEPFCLIDLANISIELGAYQADLEKCFCGDHDGCFHGIAFLQRSTCTAWSHCLMALTVYFPLEMHISRNNIRRGTIKWYGLQLLNLVCLLAALGAPCSSIQGVNKALRTYKPFKFTMLASLTKLYAYIYIYTHS
ncbi:hypothetical protein ACOSQ3_008566 [Xanthoceras sorbifolium]